MLVHSSYVSMIILRLGVWLTDAIHLRKIQERVCSQFGDVVVVVILKWYKNSKLNLGFCLATVQGCLWRSALRTLKFK